MSHVNFPGGNDRPRIVGSIGNPGDLRALTRESAAAACDIVEIRLDLLWAASGRVERGIWAHLAGLPLLFTARCQSEGGAEGLDAAARQELLAEALDDAALIDIEVANVSQMAGILAEIRRRELPWIASCHDFGKLPETEVLQEAENRALEAGAWGFKAAARIHSPADLARLAEFQLAPHVLPVSTMGMGPLAPVSRLLCAQAGSLLNYGYLGESSTAPGQWDSGLLRVTVSRLESIRN